MADVWVLEREKKKREGFQYVGIEKEEG